MKNQLLLFSLLSLSISFIQAQLPSFTSQSNLINNETDSTSYQNCVVDMNGDYLDDVVRVTPLGIYIDYQQESGDFSPSFYSINIQNLPTWSLAAGDINGNGYNDLLFGNGSRVSFVYASNNGTSYTEVPKPEGIFSQRSTFADIDNDGHLDAFVCHDVDQSHPYRNDGNGNLSLDQSLIQTLDMPGNYAAIWVDYDNDWDSDLYITKCKLASSPGDIHRTNRLYRNNGDGSYTEVAVEANLDDNAQSWATVFEDFDNDGDFDAFIVNHDFQNRFMENNGDGTFTDIIGSTGILADDLGAWENASGDFNNDGYMDIFSELEKEIYINNGDMTFTGMDLVIDDGAIGDLNNDGFLDILKGNTPWINDGNNNNWIKINTLGTQSNRNGIGARVEIYGEWGIQIREVRSGESFSPMNSLTTHFGIGQANSIDSLIVKWPSRNKSKITSPAINTTHLIVENCTYDPSAIILDGSNNICEGDSSILTAPSSNAYMWSTGETTPSITVKNAGNYQVSLTNNLGCTGTASQLITVFPAPEANIEILQGTANFCEGQNAVLSAYGGTEYLWSTQENTSDITVHQTNIYSVIVTDNNGCSDTAELNITAHPSPTAIIETTDGETSFCSGDNPTLTASGGTEYLWSTQENTAEIMINQTNIYSVVVTDENGCTNEAEQLIAFNPLPITNIEVTDGNDSFCDGDSATISASGGTTYLWNTAETTAEITVNQTNVYSVIVTDENGCTNEAEQVIEVFELPAEPAIIQIINGYETPLQIEYPFSLDGFSIQWFYNNNELVEYNDETYIPCQGEGDYVVEITDENGCQSISQVYTPIDCTTATTQAFFVEKISLFPNPTTSNLNLDIEFKQTIKQLGLEVYNNLGQSISNNQFTINNKRFQYNFNLTNLSTGIYWIKLSADNQLQVLNFVKK